MKAMFLVALALCLGACADEIDKALDETSALTDELCACQDAGCAEKVKAKLAALKARLEAAGPQPQSGKQTARAVKIALRWDRCMEKLPAPAN